MYITIPSDKKLWFLSDLHYGHTNLTKGVSNWSDTTKCRPYDTVKEMNQAVYDSCKIIGQDDIVINCGDMLFGDKEEGWQELSTLFNWSNMIYIRGNHCDWLDQDRHIEKRNAFMYYGDYLEVFYSKQRLCCFHFPMKEWHKRGKGSWACTGHSHGNLPYTDGELGIDLGWCGWGKPLSFEEIKSIMAAKTPVRVGHH